MPRAFLVWFAVLVLMVEVLGIIGLRLLSDQTTSLRQLADTAVVAGPPGDKGPIGATGPKGASAFPFTVRVAGRGCTVTNLWREGTLATYENRRLTYPATPAPFFCKA